MANKRSFNIFKFISKAQKNGKAYLNGLVHNKNPKNKFVIFSEGRTGSTLLIELLNQHEEIFCEEEIYNKFAFVFRLRVPFPYFYLKGHSRMHPYKTFGFKVKISHLTEHQNIDPFQFFNTLCNKGYRIIYLHRKDYVAQEISSLLAWHNKKYHVYKNEDYSFLPFYINPSYFQHQLERRKRHHLEELRVMKNFPHLEINYEDDLMDEQRHQQTIDTICDYLEIKKGRVKTQMKKSNVYKYKQIIQNYDQIKYLIEV